MASCSSTSISDVHEDIIETHILTRLDGPSLASVATTSSEFHALSGNETLWANICGSTWPSTNSPRIRHVISTFPKASRSFFSDSFTTVHPTTTTNKNKNLDRIPELISAVDLYYGEQVVLSKVVETETVSSWFRCSPFRVDLVEPKDAVRSRVEVSDGLRLSWIVIDPAGRRAMNISSQKAVSVRRHWLTGEVEVRFATVVGESMCGLVVTWTEGGDEMMMMQVKEVSWQMEDMDGMHLSGRESLGILQRALEGKRGRKIVGEEGEAMKRYLEFVRRKEERKERRARAEGRLDMLCVALVAFSFSAFFSMFLFCCCS